MELMTNYFLKNFFLPTPTRPTKPAPRSTSVVGSGTGLAPILSPPKVSPVEATGVEVTDLKLDVVAGSSDEGQPTIPKNIITIHKTINNFFIFFLLFKKDNNSFYLS